MYDVGISRNHDMCFEWPPQDQLDNLEESLKDGRINMGLQGDSDNDDDNGGDDNSNGGSNGAKKKLKVVTAQRFDRELGTIRDELQTVRAQQQYITDKMRRDMSTIKSLLKKLVYQQTGEGASIGECLMRLTVLVSSHTE